MGLYSGGSHTGAYIQRDFGLTADLCIPKNSSFGVQSERLMAKFNT